MEESILNSWMIDPGYIIVLSAVSLILLVIVVICIIRINKLYRIYDGFMRGKDAETLEDTIFDLFDELKDLKAEDRANKDSIKRNGKDIRNSYQKLGVVKYNAFKGMGGKLSFAIAMLDSNNSGFVLNSVHSREGCYLYLKEVDKGQTEILLGNEEKEALERALGY